MQSANTRTDKSRISIAMYVNSTQIGQKNQLSLGKLSGERSSMHNVI